MPLPTPTSTLPHHHLSRRCARLLLSSLSLTFLVALVLLNITVLSHPLPSHPPHPSTHAPVPTSHVSYSRSSLPASELFLTPSLNPHPFRFILSEPDVCTRRRPDVYLLAVIHSAPGNYRRRMQIRETFASQRLYPLTKLVTLFAIGLSNSSKVQQSIELESSLYRDIIQEDFLDSYKNLTYKGIMWLSFVTEHCGSAEFVMKADDDIFINIFNLVAHLRSLQRHRELEEKTILCLLWTRMPVLRDATSKWFVSKDEYPHDYYTKYCSGSAYIISGSLVPELYAASFRTKFFWVDDFYLTGQLPLNTSAVYKPINSLYVLKSAELQEKLVEGFAIFAHVPGNSLRLRYSLWSAVLKQRGGPTEDTRPFLASPPPL